MSFSEIQTDIPQHWALAMTDRVATYMVSRFRSRLGLSNCPPSDSPNHGLTLGGLFEVNWMVDRLVYAYLNKGP